MNRDIKFRGKRADNGDWVIGSLVMVCDGESLRRYPCIVISFNHDVFDWHEVIPETVGQFTGLTDKNGKEIFEGDIIRVTEEDEDSITGNGFEHIGIVKYGCNGKFVSDYQTSFILHCKTWYKEEGLLYSVRYGYEIIGNIHDNPELK